MELSLCPYCGAKGVAAQTSQACPNCGHVLTDDQVDEAFILGTIGAVSDSRRPCPTDDPLRKWSQAALWQYSQHSIRFPDPNESVALAPVQPKTAALAYDRVWAADPTMPASIEARLLPSFITTSMLMIDNPVIARHHDPQKSLERVPRIVCDDLRAKYSLHMEPMFHSRAFRATQYTEGDRAVVLAVIENVAAVDEDSLTWEQVEEFRGDEIARSDYRRFTHWLEKDMLGKNTSFIEKEIAIRIENYETALKKHGLLTVKSVLEHALDGKALAKAGGFAGGIFALTKSEFWSALGGTGYVVGDCLVMVIEAWLGYKEVQEEHREIAYVHEIKQRFAGKR